MKSFIIIAVIAVFICSTAAITVAAKGGIPFIEKPCTKGNCALTVYGDHK